MINVLVVEDSPVAAHLLCHILGSDPEVNVLAVAGNATEALAFLQLQRPDVITMDINMPGMDGYETTRQVMKTNPVPIVIVSSGYNPKDAAVSFSVIEAGALTILEKPPGPRHPDYHNKAREFVTTIKLMSEVKVVKRPTVAVSPTAFKATPIVDAASIASEIRLIAIGASTGGPVVLQSILSKLPKGFPFPIVIVQHISRGFTDGFARWLMQTSGYPVKVATQGEIVKSFQAYVAPDGLQMGIDPMGGILLSDDARGDITCPSVSYLFRAVAASFGCHAMGILLTGMGKDGASGLKLIRDNGGLTIAQDSESSVIYGMPAEAVRIGAANSVLSPDGIVQLLVETARRKR
ncbi:response regulator receiver modulated CheB methylesterase [Candidatus Magnetobacterium bavaricum]|uniref:Protein-glutamate methylesterase/protein-glutamine glutaminase n=1 Tax=Candidatus Magnetobacterium bavaricum TaxID=29290 RepID=A0A0F3GRF2_9BACT|nr:response regulator receiver modulated CheB methylesterase [Candidatus Magnetobacterium bavaricum]